MILELVGITKVFTEFILNYTKTNSTITKILHCLDVAVFTLNPFALRMAKTLWSFGRSECNKVKNVL